MKRQISLAMSLALALSTLVASARCEEPSSNTLSTKAQFTYGVMGAPRTHQFMSDELIFVRHETRGIIVDPGTQECDLEIEITIVDRNGNPKHKQTKFESSLLYLGDGTFTGALFFKLAEFRPGTYSATIEVRDRLAERSSKKKLDLEIIPADQFAVKDVLLSQDPEKRIYTNSYCTTGEILYLHADVVNYQVEMNQMDILVETKILDGVGKIVFDATLTHQQAPHVSRFSGLAAPLNVKTKLYTARAGEYQILLTAHDLLSGKHHQHKIPLIVVDPFATEPK